MKILKNLFYSALCLVLPMALSAEDSLLLNWKFDSPYEFGAFEYDASGRGNDGVVHWDRIGSYGGLHWQSKEGFLKGSAHLPRGVRGNISTKKTLSLPQNWTMSLLFKPLDDKTRFDHMISFHSSHDYKKNILSLGQHHSFRINLDNDGKQQILGFFKDKMSSKQWNHLALVYETEQVTFYLNGKSQTVKHTSPWNPSTKFKLSLSGLNGSPHNRSEGNFDEFRLYSSALNADQIKQLATKDFYVKEKTIPIADPGMGYTTFLKEGSWFSSSKAQFKMQGTELIKGNNAGETKFQWSIIQQPKGAKGKFADASDPKTIFSTNKIGDYKFKLTTSNEAGKDEKLVNGVVFAKDKGPKNAKLYTLPPDRIEGHMVAYHPDRAAALNNKKLKPISYWSFDKIENNEFSALGPKAHALNSDGKSIEHVENGKFGKAIKILNGPLSLGQFDELKNEFSASFWVYHEKGKITGDLLNVQGENGKQYWRNHYRKYRLDPQGTGLVDIIVKWYEGATTVKANNRWTHYVFTYAKTGNVKKLYIDGRLAVYSLAPFEKDASGKASLLCNLKGAIIDDYALYDTTLNNEEVAAIYKSSQGPLTLDKRIAYDPYTSRVYRDDFIAKNFPKPTPTYQTEHFSEDRFDGKELSPYTHPRLNMTMNDLPRIRESFLKSRHGHNNHSFMYLYTRTQFGHDLSNYTPNSKLTDKKPQYAPKNAFTIDGKYVFNEHSHSSSARIALALEALLKADTKLARKLIEQMIISANLQQQCIDYWRSQNNPGWQHAYHDILGRRSTQIMYDYLYNWMTEDEKRTIRKVIATATAGNWSIGMYAMPALYANRSNWQAWITGDMLIALQSIYGEDGFCQFTYDQAAQAVNNCAEIMNDPESGAHYEGMGKSNINSTQMSVLSRMQPKGEKIISSKALYNNVAKFHLHIGLPWTHKTVMYDQKNGGNAGIPSAPINVLHYAYPNDPIINYLKHTIDDGARSYTQHRPSTFGQESWMISSVYTQDWKGPDNLQEHLKQAVKEAGEPLAYFSDFRGQMISRSSWEKDALQLNFVPRVIKGGHSAPTKGYFVVNALERQWFEFRSRANQHSRTNSCVTVDGEGQDGTMARSLHYSGAAETKGSNFDILSSELTGSYRQINNKWPNLNYTRLKPDPRPWFDMPKQYLTHWYLGDRPYAPVYDDYDQFDPVNYKGKQEFEYAYRTALFARGNHPYIIIADDFKKDNKEREYIWHAALPDDLKKNRALHKINGDTAILTDPKDPSKHLMVKMFGYKGKGKFVLEHILPTQDVDRAKMNLTTEQMPHNLKFKNKTDMASFRVIIYPFKDGDLLPEIAETANSFTITIGNQKDSFTEESKANGHKLLKPRRQTDLANKENDNHESSIALVSPIKSKKPQQDLQQTLMNMDDKKLFKGLGTLSAIIMVGFFIIRSKI